MRQDGKDYTWIKPEKLLDFNKCKKKAEISLDSLRGSNLRF